MVFCAGERVPAQGSGGPSIFYAAGFEENSGGTHAAMVWKIGGSTVTPMALTDGTWNTEALGIVENGGSIYAGGRKWSIYEDGVALRYTAMVWKIDGSRVTPITLTDGAQSAEAWSITASGDSLYAAGSEGTWSDGVAMVWKINGSTVIPITLTDGTRDAKVQSITASGGSLYAAGYKYNGDYNCGNAVAMVWKISGSTITPITLTGGMRDARVQDITARGDSLYAAGSEGIWSDGVAMVWKIDGSRITPIILTGGTRGTVAMAIAESGGSLYAAGYEGNHDGRAAMVWKTDGPTVTPLALTLTGGTRSSAASAVIVP
ncbi:MAG: WD40 repeat domain-containing protein [Treponema sp.]|jgi:hypothetical protein|nr:WD40 repeat domain-containing protein [Treponema sp.]